VDGGRVAAFGFYYQYVRTLECLLELVDDVKTACVRVEGPPPGSSTSEAVDFDVLGHDGKVREAVQVKSRPAGRRFGCTEALRTLVNLVTANEAAAFALIINAPPSNGIDELAGLLESAQTGEALRSGLPALPGTSRELRELVADLDDDTLAALTRCRIELDARSDDQIRRQLCDVLRGHRNRSHTGLGEQSAGLLADFLIAQIFARAKDVTGKAARFEVDELRRLLLVDHETLARAVGRRDWGVVVGSMPPLPDIARGALSAQLADAFPGTDTLAVRRAVLTGLSGIGKSSLAAMHVADWAVLYDVVAWIDCETSESTADGFHQLLSALRPRAGQFAALLPAEEVRAQVHLDLGQLPGRWLLIFDNVASPRAIESWIPSSGRGDVITCTLNAAENTGTASVIPVSHMQREESTALLAGRLGIDEQGRVEHAASLNQLAERLEDWPLALALVAGYLRTCAIPLGDTAGFLNTLAERAIADADSIPPGYPRTLAAALGMCLDIIEARGRAGGAFSTAGTAALLLYGAAYLSSRRIPAHLLLAASISDVDRKDPADQGPYILQGEEAHLGESIRELRRFSIVAEDSKIPPGYSENQVSADTGRTIAVNTIVQLFVRARTHRRESFSTLLNSLLWHVDRWLAAAVALGEPERAHVLCSHAETLLVNTEHGEIDGLVANRVSLLLGNTAAYHQLMMNPVLAEDLLLRELARLDPTTEAGEVLAVHTRLTLATTAINAHLVDRSQLALRTGIPEAVEHLGYVLQVTRAWSIDYPDAAHQHAGSVQTVLNQDAVRHSGNTQLSMLAEAFDDLVSRLPATEHGDLMTSIVKAEKTLRQGRWAQAEQLCRLVLAPGLHGAPDSGARRLLIESLALQRKWDEAIDEVHYWQTHRDAPRLYWSEIFTCIRNAGIATANAYRAGDPGSVAMIKKLADWPGIEHIITAGPPEGRATVELIIKVAHDLRKVESEHTGHG
jgi:hypothetical protein